MGLYRKWNRSAESWDWYIDFRFQGQRIRERVGPNKTLAKSVLGKRKTEIAEGKFLERRKEIRTTLADMIALYINSYAKPSKRSWKDDERMLNGWLAYFGNVRLSEISPLKIEGYRAARKVNVSVATVNRELAVLRTMFSKAISWDKATVNPAKLVKPYKENNIRTRFLEKGEIDALLIACSEWLRPIVTVALNTGMRRGEIISLAWDDVDFMHGLIKVRDSKNRSPRFVDMSLPLIETLRVLPKNPDSPYLFLGVGEKRVSVLGRLRREFENALTLAGVLDCTFHTLRHTCASHLAMAGVDLLTIGAILGHRSGYVMTQRYAHLSNEHKAKAIRALDTLTCTTKMDTLMPPEGSGGPFSAAEAFAKSAGKDYNRHPYGQVAELADATDLKSVGRKAMRVRVPPCPRFKEN